MNKERLLTADDLAERWQVKASHVYRLTRQGSVPSVKLGRYYRYRLDAIEAFEYQDAKAERAQAHADLHTVSLRSLDEIEIEDGPNAAARERERLRAIAREGVCPTCGRQADEDRERDLRSYAAANARLHARLVESEATLSPSQQPRTSVARHPANPCVEPSPLSDDL